MDILFTGWQFYGLDGLCGHDSQDILPVMPDAFFPEHVPDGIYQLISQYGQVDACFDPFVILMENRSDAQVRLQASEGRFHLLWCYKYPKALFPQGPYN